jgi:LmbE family N-acetylglucosaminyl deacetylase
VKDKTVIVFSPHPDDETFGCGGTIAKRLNEGYEVLVVILTDGRHAYSKLFGLGMDPTPEQMVRIRKAEVERAMEILGLEKENLIFLNFEEGTMEQNYEEAEKKITRILMNNSPKEVYYTYERDFHRDHQATSRIVKNSIKKAKIHTMQYEYSISQKFGRARLLHVFNCIRQKTFCVDISEFLPLKIKAIEKFISQISIISKGQETPVIQKPQRFMQKKEIFMVGN